MTKRCTKCHLDLDVENYGVNRNAKDGLFHWCRDCASAHSRAYYARTAERRREHARRKYWEDPERARARTRAAREDNPELVRSRTRDWQKRNPDACSDYGRRRRAMLRGSGVIERIDRRLVFDRDGGKCHLCGKSVTWGYDATLDHLIPLTQGGDHTYQNVALAHRSCNSRRGPGRVPAQLQLIG